MIVDLICPKFSLSLNKLSLKIKRPVAFKELNDKEESKSPTVQCVSALYGSSIKGSDISSSVGIIDSSFKFFSTVNFIWASLFLFRNLNLAPAFRFLTAKTSVVTAGNSVLFLNNLRSDEFSRVSSFWIKSATDLWNSAFSFFGFFSFLTEN